MNGPLVIEVDLPPRALCGNGRATGHAASRLRQRQRGDAALTAFAVLSHHPETLKRPAFPTGRVLVGVHVRRDPLWSARPLDDDNLIRGLKSAIDGLTDAGVWKDDRQVKWGPITWEAATPLTGRVVLTLTPEEAS